MTTTLSTSGPCTLDREISDRRQWTAEEDFSHPVVNMKFSFPGERGNLYYCVFAGKSLVPYTLTRARRTSVLRVSTRLGVRVLFAYKDERTALVKALFFAYNCIKSMIEGSRLIKNTRLRLNLSYSDTVNNFKFKVNNRTLTLVSKNQALTLV